MDASPPAETRPPGTARYLRAKHHLKDQILAGKLSGRLPPERDLAKRYAMSYMTLRRAVGELVSEGLVYRVPGSGTFVGNSGRLARRTANLAFLMSPRVQGGIANAYFAKVFAGIEAAARQHGYSVFYATDWDDLLPRSGDTAARKVDGIIAAHLDNGFAPVRAASAQVPVVLIDDRDTGSRIPAVGLDNFAAGRAAMGHLLQLGHRRIGHIAGSLDTVVGRERAAAWRQNLELADLPVDPRLIQEGDFEFASGARAVERLLKLANPPTALFCANDAMALGAIKRARELGLTVPNDLSVAGIDDIDAAAQLHPALTTVAVPKEQLGRLAVATLLALLGSDAGDRTGTRLLVDAALVVRGSTKAPRGQRG